MAIATLVKSIQDIMGKDVGVDGDAQRIGQLVWLLFLKILDDKEQEWELTLDDYQSPEDRHLFNDIYEKILADLQSAGNAGEYYTPRAVTQFIVDILDPKLGESLLDPACGTGGFLTCAIEHLNKQVKTPDDRLAIEATVRGVEKKPLPHLLAMTNMMLHGIDVPTNVRRDNTLSRPLRDYKPSERVDAILTNPP
ncbi:N-6 DNA methylase [Lyngbya sp. CCY1209]|uniref:class I SAM-dependent DNA methyltransferase n=1 Tax=Lyngbya sp. CCY1209 TaxID=2886103 RepID=UPI002D20CAA9|nr:N-6 DNA methylase [Lyngbya sp. CCY1209]MEB3882056.1 type I restriction-modification system subunit M [Lyngbya sp. CCY1209]